MNLEKIKNAKVALVTMFAVGGLPTATGYVAKYHGEDGDGYCWFVSGKDFAGISFDTGCYRCPFEIPHDDFASWLASAYLGAISGAMGGGEYGVKTAIRVCFGTRL